MKAYGYGYSPIFRRVGGIDPQAQAHYDRVIADGGIIPAGLLGCNAWFVAVKAVYGVTDITTAISAGYDPHYLGAKIGAGSGTTLGQAATKLYSCSGASGDLVQETAASMPLLLEHDGVNYYQGVGVSENYCSTPNSSNNNVTTEDLELIVKASLPSFTTQSGLIGKYSSSGNANYYLFTNNKILYLTIRTGGSLVTVESDAIAALTANTIYWFKVTRTNAGSVVFYYSTDGITYTTVTSLSSTAGNLDASSVELRVGTKTTTIDPALVRFYYASMSKIIGGSPLVIFNPASYNAATSQTQWTSTTGEVWTINKSSGNTFVGVLVDRTMIQGNNTTTSMSVTIAGTQPYTEYLTATKNGVGTYVSRATGNARGHSGTNLTLANGTTLNFASTATTRQTLTYRNNGASSGIAVNNGTETTGAAGANNGTTLVLAEGAHNITTFISSLAEDSAPQRAAMYTAVKSFNNY